jgi:hypothetical protein
MAYQQQQASTNAIVALVLGIVSWVLGLSILTGIPAWIIGRNEVIAIDSGRSPEAGRTMALVGMWLGIVVTILTVIAVIVGFLFFGAIMALLFGAAATAQ